jgi:hypothetical protein
MKIARSVALMLILSVAVLGSVEGQAKKKAAPVFPLWKFDQMRVEGSCGAKGRLQDRGYCSSKLMDEIVAQGKSAIPVLISQMLDPRATERPIYDYWSYTTSGDIAYFMLNDLFTERIGKHSRSQNWIFPKNNAMKLPRLVGVSSSRSMEEGSFKSDGSLHGTQARTGFIGTLRHGVSA